MKKFKLFRNVVYKMDLIETEMDEFAKEHTIDNVYTSINGNTILICVEYTDIEKPVEVKKPVAKKPVEKKPAK